MKASLVLALPAMFCALGAQRSAPPPEVLPPLGTAKLASNLDAAAPHRRHLWRDTPPLNGDGTVNGYIEIAKGDRRKWEFDMRAHARAIDRMMPASIGGYPVNYGFIPQTVSYDGDPLDVLVLGPPIAGGNVVRGAIVGLLLMEDEKGLDSKVVVSRLDREGRPLHALTADDQRRIGDYFARYKQHEPRGYSRVSGWGRVDDARAYITTTHAFFLDCRGQAGHPCRQP